MMRMAAALLAMVMACSAGCQSGRRTYTQAELRALRQRAWEQAQTYERQRLRGWDAAAPSPPTALLRGITALPRSVARMIRRDTPTAAAEKMLDTQDADARREGVFYLAERHFGRSDESYLMVYRNLASADPDPTVRAAAIRALNRARDRASVPVFLQGLDDRNDWVRLEAAKALANVPDERATAALIERLRNLAENHDVRIAAADALRNFPGSAVARALVGVLTDRDFAIAWQARRSLWLMTARDFGYDQSAWLEYLTTADQPFV